jgi:hypothetical protein
MRPVLGIAVAAVMLVGHSAWATPLRLDFSGHVDGYTAIDVYEPEAVLGGSIHVGTLFSGYVTFDDAATPTTLSDCCDPYWRYSFASPPWVLHAELGGYLADPYPAPGSTTATIDAVVSKATQSNSHVQIGAYTVPVATPGGFSLSNFGIALYRAFDAPPLASQALSDVPWDLADYADALAVWDFEGPENLRVIVSGTLDSLTLSVVPEPESGVLVALGALGLIWRSYRRARS